MRKGLARAYYRNPLGEFSSWIILSFRGVIGLMSDAFFLTRKQTSELTGFSQATLAKWAVLKRGPRFRKFGSGRGARVRYQRSDVMAFMTGAQEKRTGSEAA